jgi:hypothetical protein
LKKRRTQYIKDVVKDLEKIDNEENILDSDQENDDKVYKLEDDTDDFNTSIDEQIMIKESIITKTKTRTHYDDSI